MKRIFSLTFASLLVLAASSGVLGCQESIATPDLAPQWAGSTLPSDAGVLGVWTLELDGEPGALPIARLVPVRGAAALGDTYALDASRYFQGGSCGDCFQVTRIAFDANRDLAVGVRLQHPFALPTPPLSPNARVDLHVFDAAVSLYGGVAGESYPALGVTVSEPVLLNPDGYSGAFDGALERLLPTPGINVHPYKLFRVDETSGNYSVGNPNGFADPLAPSGHSVLPQGGFAEETLVLHPPEWFPMLRFGSQYLLVVTANWAVPSSGLGTALGQHGNPIYYLPEGNQKAATRVSVRVPVNDLEQGVPTSSAALEIDVVDWQFGALIDPTFPSPERKDQVRFQSEPSAIRVEIPGLLATPLEIDPATGGGGWPLRTYYTSIDNAIGAPKGTYHGCIAVIDGLSSAAGIAQDDPVPFGLGQLATYALFTLEVASPTAGGGFTPSEVVSTLEPWDASGHENFNAPELIAQGKALYLSYQGSDGFGVTARKLNASSPWQSNKVFQAHADAWLDPTLGVDGTTGEVHCLISAPFDFGVYDCISTNQGATWALPISTYTADNSLDYGMAITNGGAASPVAVFNFLEEDFYAQWIGSARYVAGSWQPGASPSALEPVADDLLARLDQFPAVHRLPTGTLVTTFRTNQRFIDLEGIDYGFEPVIARSIDNGQSWRDWRYVHPFINTQQTEALSTAMGDDGTLYVLELWGTYELHLYRSTNEGLAWAEVPLPEAAQFTPFGLAEVAAGPNRSVAVIYEAQDGPSATQLKCIQSSTFGNSWSAPVSCDDDPTNLFDVYHASAAYTDDGKLHVAFTDGRSFPWVWRIVHQE